MVIEYKVTTWIEIVKKTLQLCKKIKESGFSPDVLVSVLRGGATVSAILSDCLGIKNVTSVRTVLYTEVGKPDEEVKIIQPLVIDVKDKNVLVIDDVADTGKTLKVVVEHIKEKGAKEVRVATIHLKPWSIYTPDYYIEETDKWIVYPWEYHEFSTEMIQKIKNQELSGEDLERARAALEKVQKILEELVT